MGIYGSPRETTPYLDSVISDWIRFENHFPNLSRTSGAMASILTGKHGTTTHKLHSSHVLKGRDSFEHLPGVLRGLGYSTLQLGWRHHVDARHWNMGNAFDVVNISSTKEGMFDRIASLGGGQHALTMHFVGHVVYRIQERLQHAFGGMLMVQSHKKDPDKNTITSQERIERFFEFLSAHPGPVFAQLHLDRTKDDEQMRQFDQFLESILTRLRAENRFESSVIAILTDHAEHYAVDIRVPLLMRFPTAVEHSPVSYNSQNLDLAPTLIDYLGLDVPPWMEGRSLLHPVERLDPIFGIAAQWNSKGIPIHGIPSSASGGPTEIYMTVCQRTYRLNLVDGVLTSPIVSGHTAPCDVGDLPRPEEASRMLNRHLKDRSYAYGVLRAGRDEH